MNWLSVFMDMSYLSGISTLDFGFPILSMHWGGVDGLQYRSQLQDYMACTPARYQLLLSAHTVVHTPGILGRVLSFDLVGNKEGMLVAFFRSQIFTSRGRLAVWGGGPSSPGLVLVISANNSIAN